MKTPNLILVPLLLASSVLLAQQGPGPGQGPRPPRGQPGQNVPLPPGQNDKGDKPQHRPQGPVPQLIAALDADHDMVISREEIRKAPAALRKLDRNKDGQLTVEEFGVPHPLPPRDGEGKGDRKGPRPPREGADGDAPDGPPPPQPGADDEGPQGPPPPRGDADGEDAPRPPKDDRKGPPQGDKPGRPMGPPPPVIGALDADHDGKISSDEIKNAADALRTLDKNGDGQLTRDEVAPKPPLPPKDGGQDGNPPPPPPGGEEPAAN